MSKNETGQVTKKVVSNNKVEKDYSTETLTPSKEIVAAWKLVHKALRGEFGEAVGLAFQIKDDLFDYGAEEIGKPTGIDIKEKKMTLPLIYALTKANSAEKRRIKKLVKQSESKPKGPFGFPFLFIISF